MKRPINLLTTLSTITVLLLAPFVPIGRASADPLGTITRYSTPTTNSQPYDMVAGPDGNMWFTEYNTAKIGRITTSGVITEFSLPTGYTHPKQIAQGFNDDVWFTARGGMGMFALGRVTAEGVIAMHDLPNASDMRPGLAISYYEPTSLVMAGGYAWIPIVNSKNILKVDSSGNSTQLSITTTGFPANNIEYYSAELAVFDSYQKDGILIMNNYSTERAVEKIYFDETREMMFRSLPSAWSLAVDELTGTLWMGGVNQYDTLKYITRSGTFGVLDVTPGYSDVPRDITMGPDGAIWSTLWNGPNYGYGRRVARINPTSHAVSSWAISSFGYVGPTGIITGSDMSMWFAENSGHKISRIGTGLLLSDDQDGDGLDLEYEFAQGTTDVDTDTDNDGLSDYIESAQFTGRDATFCNQTTNYCEYPDPLKRDVYVETDWMVKPAGSSMGYSMQPDATMVGSMKNAFSAKGIDLHVDTGQLGGGNEVEYAASIQYTPEHGVRDLFDYKDGRDGVGQNFASNRRDIWRYMFMGHQYAENAGSTGAALAGADDVFISYGLLKETPDPPFTSLTTAIAGTMIHELGHSLCLESGSLSYPQQSSACLFDGIDSNSASTNYVSSMNYLYQLELVDYSKGANGAGDHDDWGALGLDDFIYRDVIDEFGISGGITIEEARKAKKIRDTKGVKIYQEDGNYKVKQISLNGNVRQLR